MVIPMTASAVSNGSRQAGKGAIIGENTQIYGLEPGLTVRSLTLAIRFTVYRIRVAPVVHWLVHCTATLKSCVQSQARVKSMWKIPSQRCVQRTQLWWADQRVFTWSKIRRRRSDWPCRALKCKIANAFYSNGHWANGGTFTLPLHRIKSTTRGTEDVRRTFLRSGLTRCSDSLSSGPVVLPVRSFIFPIPLSRRQTQYIYIHLYSPSRW